MSVYKNWQGVNHLDIPLERDSFLRILIRELSGTLEEVVGIENASGFISTVGQVVGEQLNIMYKSALNASSLGREQVARFLRGRFRGVYEAENGKIGIELYKKHTPDIIITDIEMPVMDGLKMIDKLLEINMIKVIIITTAYDDEEHKSDNVCYHVIKSIIVSNLLEIIDMCLKNQGLHFK